MQAAAGMWLANINLTHEDRLLITNNQWLNDKIIDAAQSLLHKQHYVEGLDTTLLSQTASGFASAGYNCVQIHFDETRNHWFTSSTLRERVEVADSMTPRNLTASTVHKSN